MKTLKYLALLLLSATASSSLFAESVHPPILQVAFEGEQEDGLFLEIPSVEGGVAKPFKQGFNPKQTPAPGALQKVEIRKSPGKDSGSFLRVIRDVSAQPCGIEVAPAGATASLAALTAIDGEGRSRIHGAIDAFIRFGPLDKSGDFVLLDAGKRGGLRLVISSGQPQQGMIAAIQGILRDGGFDLNADGKADAPQISAISKGHGLKPDTIYHLAVTMDTDADGIVTLKLFQKEGTDAIRTDGETDLVAKAQGRPVGKFEGGFPEGTFRLGVIGSGKREKETTQDIGLFRVYGDVPTVFPEIKNF